MEPVNGMPLTADSYGLARLLDRYAEELPPQQEWREIVQNGIDAGATDIVVDGYDDPTTGRKVLRIADNGEGMTERQLRLHLTTLHLSGQGRQVGVKGNFGVGARIAGLSRNPLGMVYASRRDDGEGCAWLRKFRNGSYGLQEFPVEGPEISTTITDPDEGMLPAIVKGHGTAVMLHGSKGGDTWSESTTFRIAQYLQERYYALPIPVRVRRWDGALQKTEPLGTYFAKTSTDSGLVELADGSICEWWLFEDTYSDASGWIKVRRGIGTVLQNEILDFAAAGTQKVARYKRFGLYGKSVLARVAIVVHLPTSGGWRMNQERTDAVGPGRKRVDWDDIGQQFADNMPEEIRALLNTGRDELVDEDLAKLMDPEWFKHVNPTPVRMPDETGDSTTTADRRRTRTKRTGQSPGSPSEGPKEDPKQVSENPGVSRASEKRMARVTKWVWQDEDKWASDPMCAATYVAPSNEVVLQRGHWIFEAHVDYVMSRRDHPRQTISTAVEKAYGLELAAKVMHILSMKARGVTDSSLEQFLSDEALTSSACGLMAVSLMIDEELDRLAAS